MFVVKPHGGELVRDSALAMSVRLYRSPVLARSLRRMGLPEGILQVIKIAAGCEATTAAATELTGLDPGLLAQASSLYLLVVLFEPGTSPWRMLGVQEGASAAEVREHKIWLMKWLHPDRNHSAALSGLSSRITDAASLIQAGIPDSPAMDAGAVKRGRHGSRGHRLRYHWVAEPLTD